MTWQEPIAALMVAWAVYSLYRHIRNLIGPPRADAPKAGCHGCAGDESASKTQLRRS